MIKFVMHFVRQASCKALQGMQESNVNLYG